MVRSSKRNKRENTSKKWVMIGAAFIVLMTLICYLPAIRGGYIWDDNSYVTHNLTLRTFDGLRSIWFEIGAVPQYYPLVHTSFWIEYHLWQLNPLGYHLVNVVLHTLNAILLWLLLRRLAVPGAWLAAVVFALHPVHVESVAWITERKNVLSSFFYLSAILAYLRFLGLDTSSSSSSLSDTPHSKTSPINKYHWGYYALALTLYLCALLSKTVACSMPAALLLLLWWKRDRIGWRTALPLVPYFLVGVVLGLTTVWMEKHRVGAQGEEWVLSFLERCLIAGRALWFYAGKLFWPHKLIFIYPRWQIDAGIWWQYLFPLAAIAVFTILWLLRRQIGKAPLVAVLFFAGTLFPALGFFDVYPMRFSFVADHFQYLASTGLIVLCVAFSTTLLQRLGPLNRTVGCAAYGVIILMLGMRVWQQGYMYKDVETLWRVTIAKNPSAWIAYNNLGHFFEERGRFDEGIPYLKQAIVLKPNFVDAHYNLGLSYHRKGMVNKAIAEYKKTLEINPHHAKGRTNLGLAYDKKGMVDEAIAEYKTAISIKPNLAEAHGNLGLVYYKKGMVDEAISQYKKALSFQPNLVKTRFNLGAAYYKKGMVDKAIAEYKKLLTAKSNLARAHYNLSLAYYKKGNYKLAIAHCDRAVKQGFRVSSQFLKKLEPYR